jgi:hypothetical protein
MIPVSLGVAIIALAAALFFFGFKHGVHTTMGTIHERLDALEAEVAALKSGPAQAEVAALSERLGKIEADVGIAAPLAPVDQPVEQQA